MVAVVVAAVAVAARAVVPAAAVVAVAVVVEPKAAPKWWWSPTVTRYERWACLPRAFRRLLMCAPARCALCRVCSLPKARTTLW